VRTERLLALGDSEVHPDLLLVHGRIDSARDARPVVDALRGDRLRHQLLKSRLRDLGFDQLDGRLFQHARGVAIRIPVDLAAHRVLGLPIDARKLERLGVGHGEMPHGLDVDRMVRGHRVEFLAGEVALLLQL